MKAQKSRAAAKARGVKKTHTKASKLTIEAWIKDPERPPTPGQVRMKLRNLMTKKSMSASEVQKLIGCGPSAWSKLMNGKYKGGVSGAGGNEAYQMGSYFFWKEKKLGKEGQLAPLQAKAKPSAKSPFPDISKVKTDGKTYLTPAETRRELLRLMRNYKVTQANFAKMVRTSSITKFMESGGEFGGGESESYDGLAAICEKVRIATGKPKSKKRLALEHEVGRTKKQPFLGVNTQQKMWLSADCYAAKDGLGRAIVKHAKKG